MTTFGWLRRGAAVLPIAVAMSATVMLWRGGTPCPAPEPAPAVALAWIGAGASELASLRPRELIPPYHDARMIAPTTEVRCRVISADDGRAIADAQVEMMQDELCVAAPDPVCAAERTDARGWVRFDAAPKRTRLRVVAAGYAPETSAAFDVGSVRVERCIALAREIAATSDRTARPR